ncbi:unnamed protein product [Meloidogyne enterolobii]|uniref:Uncharacterized protein n=1 Tax=Meloidogyne enterolobii TaxID=390850 RepID=A0ACB0ZBJ6_MELEN
MKVRASATNANIWATSQLLSIVGGTCEDACASLSLLLPLIHSSFSFSFFLILADCKRATGS